jgi:hypothetical protein
VSGRTRVDGTVATAALLLVSFQAHPSALLAAASNPPPSGPEALRGAVDRCTPYRAAHPKQFVLSIDVPNRQMWRPASRTYDGTTIVVCVDEADLRYRLGVSITETPLPAAPKLDLGGLRKPESASAPALFTPAGDGVLPRAKALGERRGKSILALARAISRLTGDTPLPVSEGDSLRSTLWNESRVLAGLPDELADLQPLLEASTKDPKADQAAIDEAKAAIAALLAKRPVDDGWIEAARRGLAQLEAATRQYFQLSPSASSKVDLDVRGVRLVVTTPGDADKAPAVGDAPAEVLVGTSFEVRSLTRVRVAPGLVFTPVSDRQFRIASNEIGAPVITGTDGGVAVPMLFFGHYWCAADVREVQPFDEGPPCDDGPLKGAARYLPTFTVGIPLSRSPLENFFAGLLWQPVPAIAFVYGAHLGKVARLRDAFVEGAAAPPDISGFRLEDAIEKRWVLGAFFGVSLSDALFVTILKGVLK